MIPTNGRTKSFPGPLCLPRILDKHIRDRVGRDSSVGIATRYGLDNREIESRWGTRFFAAVQMDPEAHPASYTMGTGSFPGVKWPRRGVNHPPHTAPRLKKE